MRGSKFENAVYLSAGFPGSAFCEVVLTTAVCVAAVALTPKALHRARMEGVRGRVKIISQRALPPGVWVRAGGQPHRRYVVDELQDKVCSRLLHFRRHLQGNLDGSGQADKEFLSLVSELGGLWMGECFEEVVE